MTNQNSVEYSWAKSESLLARYISELSDAQIHIAQHVEIAKKKIEEARAANGSGDTHNAIKKLVEGGETIELAKRFIAVSGSALDEWKECRISIDRFDKLQADLRKTGHTFTASALGLSSLLLGQGGSSPVTLSDDGKFVVLTAIMFLTVGLFCYDWMLGRWLGAAVSRAEYIEKHELHFEITKAISTSVDRKNSWLVSFAIHATFWGTAFFLLKAAIGGAMWFFSGRGNFDCACPAIQRFTLKSTIL